jgi:diaminohydroxyphosphoribosylaminopyrimidine deaminase/5-amino-6-(5-phosphoribosylamino)uracil reductase
VTTNAAPANAVQVLDDHGCEILVLPADGAGRPEMPLLLAELGRRRWTNLLVEGGAAVLGSLLDAQLIDEVHVFIAPTLIGGSDARIPIGGSGAESIGELLRFTDHQIEQVDGDAYWHGRLTARSMPQEAHAGA